MENEVEVGEGEKAKAEPVEEDDAFLGRFQLARRLDG